MSGERIESATLTSVGIPGDRGWAVYDHTRNGITGAKRLPPLRGCRARYTTEPPVGASPPAAEITFPDGSRASSDSARTAELLGALVGRAVTLHALGGAHSAGLARVTSADETAETVRTVMGLLPGEPEADMSEFPPERLRQLRQGNFFDALPLHLLTLATLRTLERIAPESTWDERRFRPNLVVELEEGTGYPELAWLGRRVRVGGATIQIVTGCPRCVMVTQPVDGELPQDHQVMRTLVRETRHTAGVYARVASEGDVRVGDGIELLDLI